MNRDELAQHLAQTAANAVDLKPLASPVSAALIAAEAIECAVARLYEENAFLQDLAHAAARAVAGVVPGAESRAAMRRAKVRNRKKARHAR